MILWAYYLLIGTFVSMRFIDGNTARIERRLADAIDLFGRGFVLRLAFIICAIVWPLRVYRYLRILFKRIG